MSKKSEDDLIRHCYGLHYDNKTFTLQPDKYHELIMSDDLKPKDVGIHGSRKKSKTSRDYMREFNSVNRSELLSLLCYLARFILFDNGEGRKGDAARWFECPRAVIAKRFRVSDDRQSKLFRVLLSLEFIEVEVVRFVKNKKQKKGVSAIRKIRVRFDKIEETWKQIQKRKELTIDAVYDELDD